MVLDVFGCQGNFVLWVITEARERWFTLGWLRFCAWTAAAVGWIGTPPRGQSATFIWEHAACVPSDLGLLPLTLYRCVFLGSSHSSRLPHVRFSLNSAAAVVG